MRARLAGGAPSEGGLAALGPWFAKGFTDSFGLVHMLLVGSVELA